MTNHNHINTFSIKVALNEGWRLTKKNWAGLIALGILSIIISSAIMLALGLIFGFDHVMADEERFDLGSMIISLIHMLLYSVFALNNLKILIDYARGGDLKIFNIFQITQPIMRQAFKFFLTSLLYGLIMMIGLILLIVPGVYFAIKYCFVFNVLADKDITISEAFKLSAKLTEGNMWKLIGLYFVSLLIIIVGMLALLVGVIPAIMLTYMAYFYVYTHLMGKHKTQHTNHSSDHHHDAKSE